MTCYVLYTLGQDFFFNTGKAERDLGFRPLYSREEAVCKTLRDMDDGVHPAGRRLRTLQAQAAADTGLHTLHAGWGALLTLAGAGLFVWPAAACRHHALDVDPLAETLAQTTGLIVAVLGVYSAVAGCGVFPPRFFRVLGVAYTLTAGLLFDLVWRREAVPAAFLPWAALALAVGCSTFHMAGGARAAPVVYDRLALAQSVHGALSGAFNAAMLCCPALVLLGLFPGQGSAGVSASALAWAHIMVRSARRVHGGAGQCVAWHGLCSCVC